MKTDFEIMQQMSSDNQDIRSSVTLVETKGTKQGGLVTMGVDHKTLQDISFPGNENKYYVALYVINKKEFDKIKQS